MFQFFLPLYSPCFSYSLFFFVLGSIYTAGSNELNLIALHLANSALDSLSKFYNSHPEVKVSACVIGLDYGRLPAKRAEGPGCVDEIFTFCSPTERKKILKLAQIHLEQMLSKTDEFFKDVLFYLVCLENLEVDHWIVAAKEV